MGKAIGSTHLLLWGILLTEDSDQSQESIEVPPLTFFGDLECEHPVVDQLTRDYLPVVLIFRLRKPCGSHLSGDVLSDLL